MNQLYQVEVIPLTQLPLTRAPYFTYKSEEDVPYGSLLEVPFGSQMLLGISTKCVTKKGSFPSWIKAIISVKETSVLTPTQITFAEEVSKHTFTPLGRVLRHTIPKAAKKLLDAPDFAEPSQALSLTKNESLLLSRFLKQAKPALYTTTTLNHDFVFGLVESVLKSKKQVVILVPEILQLLPLEAAVKEYFSPSIIATLHSHLTPKEYKSAWNRIQNHEASIILATRQGLFAPFASLGAVIVTEEQDQGYKQWDMSPRYHGRYEAKTLATLHKAKLLYTTPAPSLESFYEIDQGKLLLLKEPLSTPVLSQIDIINLRMERYRKNFSPISEELRAFALETLKAGKQILIIVPQRGIASYSVCASCKKIFRCPKSSHPLREHKSGRYSCLGCDYETSLFPSCNACGHLVFWQRGIGSEKIEVELKKLFPYSKIARLDGETVRKHKDLRETYDGLIDGTIQIVIGTHMLEKKLPLPRLSLIAMIDADNPLSSLDFRGDERFLQTLTQLSLDRNPSDCRLVIQTFEPEHRLLRTFQEKSYQEIAKCLLLDRIALRYPPASTTFALTKNILTPQNEKKAELALAKLQKDFPLCTASQPREKKLALKVGPHILLRMPNPTQDDFEDALLKITPFYTVDRHPLHFS
jgi:primosomal protein N' (replication factor Y)